VCHADYKHLLKFIGLGLEKWDEDIAKQEEALKAAIAKGTTPQKC
jgi:hypothetical protein